MPDMQSQAPEEMMQRMDIRKTRLFGVMHAPHGGACMMVRSRDDICRVVELVSKKTGLSDGSSSTSHKQDD
jgi:hypothetical protein